MTEFTEPAIRSLIAHMRDEKSLTRHDIGHYLPEILESLLGKVDYLEKLVARVRCDSSAQ